MEDRNEKTKKFCSLCGNALMDGRCVHCDTDVPNSDENESADEKQIAVNKGGSGFGIGSVILIILVVILLASQCSKGKTDSYSATCTECGDTYSYEPHEYGGTAQRNVKCIRMTNLCLDCYHLYCWSIGKTPEYN